MGYGASLELPWAKSPEASGNTGDYPTSKTVSNFYTYFHYYTPLCKLPLNKNFVYFTGVLIVSFFLMLCEVNITEIFKEI